MFYMDGETGRLIWDIQEIDQNTYTIDIEYSLGDESYQSTLTGDKDEIRGQIASTPAGIIMMASFFSFAGAYRVQQLKPGNQWLQTYQGDTVTYRVIGQENYAGVNCYTTEITHNQKPIHRGCFSPNLGLTAHTALYNETGQKTMEMKLKEYS